MKIVQTDIFGDGWYVDVQLDTGERVLLHIYDPAGYKAKYPGDELFLKRAQELLDARAAEPVPVAPVDYQAKYAALSATVKTVTADARLTKAQMVTALAAATAEVAVKG